MQSQIGQVSSGQNTNPLLLLAGNNGGAKTPKNAKTEDTFQMVLAGTAASARRSDEDTSGAVPEDAATPVDPETAEELDLTPEASDLTPHIDGGEDIAVEDIAARDDLPDDTAVAQPETDDSGAVMSVQSSETPILDPDTPEAELPAAAPRPADAEIRNNIPNTKAAAAAKAAVPAWFAPARADVGHPGPKAETPADDLAPKTPVLPQGPDPRSNIVDPGQLPPGKMTGDVDGIQIGNNRTALPEGGQMALPIDPITGQKVASPTTPENRAGGVSAAILSQVAPNQAAQQGQEPAHVEERRIARERPTVLPTPQAGVAANGPATPPTATAGPPQAIAAGLADKLEGKSNIRWMSDISFVSDTPALDVQTPSRVAQNALFQQPELPRNIAAQIAQAMQNGRADRPMELVLSPAELGRVRISMQASDAGMTVQVIADRPETLDLMRRHIDVLAQEFHDIGFGSANFTFGQNGSGENPGNSDGAPKDVHHSSAAKGETSDTTDPVHRPHLKLHADRVDIRL